MSSNFIGDLKVRGFSRNVSNLVINELKGKVIVKDEKSFTIVSDGCGPISLRRFGPVIIETERLEVHFSDVENQLVVDIPMRSRCSFSEMIKEYQAISYQYSVELIARSSNMLKGLTNNIHITNGEIIKEEKLIFDYTDYMVTNEDYEWDVLIESSSNNPFENRLLCGNLDKSDEMALAYSEQISMWDIMLE